MLGLRWVHETAGRWAAWTDLVDEILPLVEDRAAGDPLPGHEAEWTLVTEWRIGPIEQRKDTGAALALLRKRTEVDRRRAGPTLTESPERLDEAGRRLVRTLAVSLQMLGGRQVVAGDPSCVRTLNEAIALFGRLGLRRETAITMFNLGHALKDAPGLRDLDAAETAYRKSLGLFTDHEILDRAKCHNQLGHVFAERFRDGLTAPAIDPTALVRFVETALQEHQAALKLIPEDADADRAVVHNAVGVLLAAVGDVEPAADHYLAALRHEVTAGNLEGMARTRSNLANLYRRVGRTADALDYARAALADWQRFGERAAREVAELQGLIALIAREGGGS